jgi:hypothetical protein
MDADSCCARHFHFDTVFTESRPSAESTPSMADPLQLPLFPNQASLTRIRPFGRACSHAVGPHRHKVRRLDLHSDAGAAFCSPTRPR